MMTQLHFDTFMRVIFACQETMANLVILAYGWLGD